MNAPIEAATDNTTESPRRLFRVISTITYRFERDGRTRRFDGVPLAWTVNRSPEEAPFDATKVAAQKEKVQRAAAFHFTRDEALGVLSDLEEKYPESEHRLESVPLPAPTGELTEYGSTRHDHHVDLESTVRVVGHPYLREAEREGWEVGDTLWVERTFELPEEMAERIEKKHNAAEYLRKLEETAEAVSKAPDPHSQELPF